MKKEFWKSKTIWGGLLFALASFVMQTRLMPESLVTSLVQWAGGLLGVYGIRDALD